MANTVTTKLKCKPCNLFYKDDGSVSQCEKCGDDLKQIKVHHVTIKSVKVISKKSKVTM